MAETSSLLNCRTGSRTGGSNPPPSAPRGFLCESTLNIGRLTARSIHLMVRIQDSQSWHRGSIPLSTTKEVRKSLFSVLIGYDIVIASYLQLFLLELLNLSVF